MWHMYEGGHFWGLHWMWLIFWIAIIVLIFITLFRLRPIGKKEYSALDILKRRFANGEIDKEEYKERKKMLEEK